MNLLEAFTGFQRVYGTCPCCGELFRLSEAAIFVSTPPPKTEFDALQEDEDKLQASIARFEDGEEKVRESARTKGREAAKSRLATIAPFFVAKGIDPNDAKVLFDPILYLVFEGMTDGICNRLQFVDPPPDNSEREKVHRTLAAALRAGHVEWRTLEVQDDGRIVSSSRR